MVTCYLPAYTFNKWLCHHQMSLPSSGISVALKLSIPQSFPSPYLVMTTELCHLEVVAKQEGVNISHVIHNQLSLMQWRVLRILVNAPNPT